MRVILDSYAAFSPDGKWRARFSAHIHRKSWTGQSERLDIKQGAHASEAIARKKCLRRAVEWLRSEALSDEVISSIENALAQQGLA
jgi:hypothetical protein